MKILFRGWPTVLAGSVLFLSCAFLVAVSICLPPDWGIPSPGQALARVTERTLILREEIARVPPWERPLHALCDPSLGTEEELADLVRWNRDLASRTKDSVAAASLDRLRAGSARDTDPGAGRRLLFRYRVMTGLDLAVLFLFFSGGILFLKKPPGFWKAGSASIPLPWPFPAGISVLIRGAAAGIALSFAWAFLPVPSHPAGLLVSYLLWTLPVIFWVERHLLRPNHLRLEQELGLEVPIRRWGKLLFIAGLALGADSLGGWLIGTTGTFLRLPNHWAEHFDADLVFGSRAVLLSSLLGIVLAGPFFEEVVFRGFLYGTLRGRYGRAASAAISAGLFSVVHGYGALGFLTVFWSGVVFAWAYEESGSLWPCAAAHAAGNLLYSLNVVAILR